MGTFHYYRKKASRSKDSCLDTAELQEERRVSEQPMHFQNEALTLQIQTHVLNIKHMGSPIHVPYLNIGALQAMENDFCVLDTQEGPDYQRAAARPF